LNSAHRHLDLELVDRLELLPADEAVDNDGDVDISEQKTRPTVANAGLRRYSLPLAAASLHGRQALTVIALTAAACVRFGATSDWGCLDSHCRPVMSPVQLLNVEPCLGGLLLFSLETDSASLPVTSNATRK